LIKQQKLLLVSNCLVKDWLQSESMSYCQFLTQLRALQLQGNAVGRKSISKYYRFFL